MAEAAFDQGQDPLGPHLLRSGSGCSRQAWTRPFLWRDAARRCTFLRVPARCCSWPQWPWHSISKPRATKRGSGHGVCSRDRLPGVPASLIHVMHNQRASVRIPASSAKNLTGGNKINGASNGKETVEFCHATRAASVLADSRGLVSSRGSCCCAVCASSLRHENVPCPGGAQHRRSVSSRASKQNCTGQNQKNGAEIVQKDPVLNPTAEIHFTEGSQGNSCVGVNGFTKLKWFSAAFGGAGAGPHASLGHPGGMPDFPHRTPVLAPRRGATSHHA